MLRIDPPARSCRRVCISCLVDGRVGLTLGRLPRKSLFEIDVVAFKISQMARGNQRNRFYNLSNVYGDRVLLVRALCTGYSNYIRFSTEIKDVNVNAKP